MLSIIPRSRRAQRIVLSIILFVSACLFFLNHKYNVAEEAWSLAYEGCDTLFFSSPLICEGRAMDSSGPEIHDSVSSKATLPHETTLSGTTIHGFTTFDNLYLHNSTYYIVTSTPADFPSKRNIVAFIRKKDSLVIEESPEGLAGHDEEPTDQELRFITPDEAKVIFGDTLVRIGGFSVILDDDRFMIRHYYHWWGEIILGMVRVYSALGTPIPNSLAQPSRFILPYVNGNHWRDSAGVDGPLMRAAFPNASIEGAGYWGDLEDLLTTVVFERAMIISRIVAHRHPYGSRWFKMLAGAMEIEALPHFWEPTRRTVVKNFLGYVPEVDERGAVASRPHEMSSVPLVTYVSRQKGGRRLSDESHEGLVNALKKLAEEGLCRVYVAEMQNMNLKEQIALASRTTIMVGVHGNGLTHQLWMPPSRYSTVMEIFNPQTYVFDYELPARNLGHRHYAVWNDTLVTYPPGTYHDGIYYGDHFSGNNMPAHGPAVANTIRERLAENF